MLIEIEHKFGKSGIDSTQVVSCSTRKGIGVNDAAQVSVNFKYGMEMFDFNTELDAEKVAQTIIGNMEANPESTTNQSAYIEGFKAGCEYTLKLKDKNV